MFELLPSLNIYWVLATLLCIWFLFVYAPSRLVNNDSITALLVAHLVCSYSIYLACVHNALLTPSTFNGAARPFHIWIGRIGLVLGIVGVISGYLLAWGTDVKDDLGFAIGISVGGFVQVLTEIFGFIAIKKFQNLRDQIKRGDYESQQEKEELEDKQDKALIFHVGFMIPLFVLACGIPAIVRIAKTIENNAGVKHGFAIMLPILHVVAVAVSRAYAKSYRSKIHAKRAEQRKAEKSPEIALDEEENLSLEEDRKCSENEGISAIK